MWLVKFYVPALGLVMNERYSQKNMALVARAAHEGSWLEYQPFGGSYGS